MAIDTILKEKKSTIVKQWLEEIIKTYPADTQRFFKKQKDPFANPVGTTMAREIEQLYEEFLKGTDSESMSPILDRIIRIRAIQDFTPSQALIFIFSLKDIIRQELGKEMSVPQNRDEMLDIYSRVDELALLGFDIYSKCREQLFEIRTDEAKTQVSGLLRRLGRSQKSLQENPS